MIERFPETCSMYEAVKRNMSGSKNEPANAFYGKNYTFAEVF